jgi:hypothetical protein
VTCEQGFISALQKSTCPGETALPPEVTVAVRVMTPPDETDAGETTRTVEVSAGVAPYTGLVKKERGRVAKIKKRRRRRKALMGEATCASNNRGSVCATNCSTRFRNRRPVIYNFEAAFVS